MATNFSYRIDYPSFDNRNDGDLAIGGGGSTNRPMYYTKLTINFVKNGESVTGITYNGTYSSYNSDGSSITNTFGGRYSTSSNSTVGVVLYSYFTGKAGSITINAKTVKSDYCTYTASFMYPSASGEKNANAVTITVELFDNRIILPSVYKPFFFNAALVMRKGTSGLLTNAEFYCSIANAIPYRMNDGKYVIGTPTLTIDNTEWYIYNTLDNYKKETGHTYSTFVLNAVEITNEKNDNKHFYVPTEASSFTKNYEVRFITRIKIKDDSNNIIIDPTLPHNYAFSVEEGYPSGYNGELGINQAEDTIYGVKFFDVAKDEEKSTNDAPYVYTNDISYGGIRHFFMEASDWAGDGSRPGVGNSLENISALDGYTTDPRIWKSVHTFVWNGKNGDYNIYDMEFNSEYDSENNIKNHFETKNQSDIFMRNKIYQVGIVDKYTMLAGDTLHDTSTDYGTETTENKYSLYTKVPRHTDVLSVIYQQQFV